jgi:predicted Zn finger-like uncharacterized protein
MDPIDIVHIKCTNCPATYKIKKTKLPKSATSTKCKQCGTLLKVPGNDTIIDKKKSGAIIAEDHRNHEKIKTVIKNSLDGFDFSSRNEKQVNSKIKESFSLKSFSSSNLKQYFFSNKKSSAIFGLLLATVASIFFIFSSTKLSTDELVEKTEKSVALIEAHQGHGTGFIVKKKLLATNYHIVEKTFPNDIKVTFPACDSKKLTITKVVFFDDSRDLVIFEIDCPNPSLVINRGKVPKKGEDLIIIGNPGVSNEVLLKNSVTRGTLNSEATINEQKYYQISASINPGNSGGPAFNFNGEVVGMLTLKASRQEGIAFGIPSTDILNALSTIDKMAEKDKDKINDFFIANSLTKRLATYGGVNLYAMSAYIKGMKKAVDLHLNPSEGLQMVSNELDPKLEAVNKHISPNTIEQYLRKIHQNPLIESTVKESLFELWKCSNQIREAVDHPKGNLSTYTDQRNIFLKKYENLIDTLKVRLNISDL